jgi:hypothetical protein
MTVQQPQIHVGLPDFADPTLLLVGDAAAFRWLASELRARREVTLGKQQPGAQRASLQILPDETDGPCYRQGGDFSWRISSSEAERVARQLSGLADSQRPAHAYIDPTANLSGVQILASVGEYDPAQVL